MTRPVKLGLISLAVMAVLWLGYTKVVKQMYLEPRAVLLKKVKDATTKLAEYRTYRDDQPRVTHEIGQFIDRTLGGDFETVDHKLRSRLSRIAEQIRVKNIAVGTSGAARPFASPAKAVFDGSANRALKEEFDFLELEGWVSGTGAFAQVLSLVDAVEAEPWIKRIDEIKFDPSDNGERFNVTVRLTTLFLPGKAPNPDATVTVSRPGPERFRTLASLNPFRVPPANAQPAGANAAPAGFPYGQWAVTGIAQSLAGSEVWLLNTATRESRRLALGEHFHDVTLIAARGEIAEFAQGPQRFSVRVGQNLGDRSPLTH
jgi:hypothetical protein